MTDFYKVLQVDPSAEFDVIRAAYRVLAAKHHPDAGGSAKQMAIINVAWDVLSDRATRAEYDRARLIQQNGARWDAYAARPSEAAAGHGRGTIVDYGRYAGWPIPEIAKRDPEYLEWLARTPSGRRYQDEIREVLAGARAPMAAAAKPESRRRFGRL
jgi:curved DNA-binding protein CbpA